MRLLAFINRVHKDGTLSEEVAMLFQEYVADRKHQRVTRMEHGGEGRARFVERADSFPGEADALVTLQHRCEFSTVAAGDNAITLANRSRNVRYLKASRFPWMDRPTKRVKGFHEK